MRAHVLPELQTNPYQPPSSVEDSQVRPGVWNAIGRVCVLIYGVLFASDCIAGTIDGVVSREPMIKTVYWIVMSVLTTYGILALAIRRIRIPQLFTFWKYFAVALPFLTCLAAAWKIYQDPPLSGTELFTVCVIFAVMTTPAFVFNWMVRHRLKEPNHRLR
ncbi:hypothetical protein FYK55_27605 [Roseiconus nitratireducens]|uniref:Uncharacterized protein n=1 Tax=Roseiconus nitratireducens TaxID=2605748 RepID=A0A5M6CYY5_9BACT|nr:hypothetical protein [Roseiconus nitratireducens]KAA5538509.1 hypothetical protein FYK55_27605 [Roseiconus nitratireducens]